MEDCHYCPMEIGIRNEVEDRVRQLYRATDFKAESSKISYELQGKYEFWYEMINDIENYALGRARMYYNEPEVGQSPPNWKY